MSWAMSKSAWAAKARPFLSTSTTHFNLLRQRRVSGLAGANSDRIFDGSHKDFSIPDLSRPAHLDDRGDELFNVRVRDDDFNARLRKERRFIFGAAPLMADATLLTVTANFDHHHSGIPGLL